MNAHPLLEHLTRGERVQRALREGGYLLVRHTEGLDDLPAALRLSEGGSAQVVGVGDELHLRHALWKAGGPVVAILQPGFNPPPDLLLGAVHRQVHLLSGDEVLSATLGVTVQGIDEQELRLLALTHASELQAALSARTTPTILTKDLLIRLLLDVQEDLRDLRLREQRPEALLQTWLERVPSLRPVVLRLASTALEEHHGEPGRILAWALQGGAERIEALITHGALLSVGPQVPPMAWGPLKALLSANDDPEPTRARITRLVGAALPDLRHHLRTRLREADTLARKLFKDDDLCASPLLPLAFDTLADRIARRLSDLSDLSDPDPADILALHEHVLARSDTEYVELLTDMGRLRRGLTQRARGADPASRATAYADEGAFFDLCISRIGRGLVKVPHFTPYASPLIERAWASRDEDNLAWVRALAPRYAKVLHGRSQDGVIGLHNLIDDLVCPVLDAGKPVFLLVLDGCSMPVFIELLDQLSDDRHGVGIALRQGELKRCTGLAPLPTITSHARGALFSGQIPQDPFALETVWRETGERRTDPARLNQHPTLRHPRKLFLKGDLADGGAALNNALRQPELALVAAVFNAVDDRIGSHDTGQILSFDVDHMHGLMPALKAALHAGREVLLTADHGHSLYRGKDLRVGSHTTPRFLPLGPQDEVPEGFEEIDCGGLAGQPGRMAFACRSGVYLGRPQVGFHGGCSLEEMVVPVAWLCLNGLPMTPPRWWSASIPAPDPATQAPAARTLVAPAQRPQPSLAVHPNPAPPPEAPRPRAAPTAPTGGPALPDFAQSLSEDEQRALRLLLRDGALRTSDIARVLGRPPQRVAGMLAKLGRRLHPHARLDSQALDDGEKQWRYRGPEESP